MYTCYHCGKMCGSNVVHVGVPAIARKTGFNWSTNKAVDMDFPKAYHPRCFEQVEAQSAKELAA